MADHFELSKSPLLENTQLSPGNKFAEEATKLMREHPGAVVGTAIVTGAAASFVASRITQRAGGFASLAMVGAEREALSTAAETSSKGLLDKIARPVEARAGQSTLAETFKAGAPGSNRTFEGSIIPDMERPFLQGATLNTFEFSLKAKASYEADLIKLASLPHQAEAAAGENLATFAERTLKERAKLTGERVNPDSIAKETERLSKLNPSVKAEMDLSGLNLVTADGKAVIKFAEELQFKHVPQIGQFMKGTGKITEEHIEAALTIQRGMPQDAQRRFLGEILVDNKLAQQADVDAAFAHQQELKSVMKSVREKFFAAIPSS